MPSKPVTYASSCGPGGSPGQNVSLDVLCRRAERLIDSVRMMGEQVDQMFARPQRVIDEANQTARSLLELRKQLEDKLSEVQAAEQSCGGRLDEFKKTIPTIHQSAEALIQRVNRARQLTDLFGKMMESSADKIAALQSASDEAVKARGAIDNAICELARVQKAADHWSVSMSALTTKHTELITAGNAAASRLRALTDAGERLGETVRQDIVALRELLRESRHERIAWEQLLTRMAGAAGKASGAPAAPTSGSHSDSDATRSVPAALADRVRRLADLVRQATGATPAPSANTAQPRPASRSRTQADTTPVPVAADAD